MTVSSPATMPSSDSTDRQQQQQQESLSNVEPELKDLLASLQDPALGGEAYAQLLSHMVLVAHVYNNNGQPDPMEE